MIHFTGRRAALLLAVAFAMLACGGSVNDNDVRALAAREQIDPDALVIREGVGYAARGDGGQLQVVMMDPANRETPVSIVATSSPQPVGSSVRVAGGGPNRACCTLVFGTGSAEVDRVEIVKESDERSTAMVRDGLWLAVFPAGDINPDDISWRFLAADGSVVDQGRGLHGSAP